MFITTAVSADPKSEFKTGLYGGVASAKDRSRHSFRVYCLDRHTGKVLWQHEAFAGVPKVKRHTKATHANATPVTDGKVLVVSFASEGLFAYDLDGKPLWKRDWGVLDAGLFSDPETQWESASSPILFGDLVILQCDRSKDSFIVACNKSTGSPVWRTPRDEPSSWGTPTVIESKTGPELVTNGTNAIRGYDPSTGKELWRITRNSQITVPTPIFGDGLIFVTSGYRPIQPIYAVRPGSSGDLTLKDNEESSGQIAWSKMARRAVHANADLLPRPSVLLLERGHRDLPRGADRQVALSGASGRRQRLHGIARRRGRPAVLHGRGRQGAGGASRPVLRC